MAHPTRPPESTNEVNPQPSTVRFTPTDLQRIAEIAADIHRLEGAAPSRTVLIRRLLAEECDRRAKARAKSRKS